MGVCQIQYHLVENTSKLGLLILILKNCQLQYDLIFNKLTRALSKIAWTWYSSSFHISPQRESIKGAKQACCHFISQPFTWTWSDQTTSPQGVINMPWRSQWGQLNRVQRSGLHVHVCSSVDFLSPSQCSGVGLAYGTWHKSVCYFYTGNW